MKIITETKYIKNFLSTLPRQVLEKIILWPFMLGLVYVTVLHKPLMVLAEKGEVILNKIETIEQYTLENRNLTRQNKSALDSICKTTRKIENDNKQQSQEIYQIGRHIQRAEGTDEIMRALEEIKQQRELWQPSLFYNLEKKKPFPRGSIPLHSRNLSDK